MQPGASTSRQGRSLVKRTSLQHSSSISTTTPASSSVSIQMTSKRLSKPASTQASTKTLPKKPSIQNHCQTWKSCQACPLHETRHKTALFRGDFPCDVLIVGNSPNEAENIWGSPLIGDDGKLLDELIALCLRQTCRMGTLDEEYGQDYDVAFDTGLTTFDGIDKVIGGGGTDCQQYVKDVHKDYPSLSVGITNINACIPWKVEKFVRSGIRPLTKVEAVACRPRLLDLINLCKPKAIVTLGKEATRFLPKPKEGLPSTVQFVEEIVHPNALNRMERDDPIRHQECRNRSILTLIRVKRKLWGIEE